MLKSSGMPWVPDHTRLNPHHIPQLVFQNLPSGLLRMGPAHALQRSTSLNQGEDALGPEEDFIEE